MRHWHLLGIPNDPRILGFQAALQAQKAHATLARYHDNPAIAFEALKPNTIVRFDSPAWSFAAVRQLMQAGEPLADVHGFKTFSSAQIKAAQIEKGELITPPQFFYGLIQYLQQASELCQQQDVQCLSYVPDIALFYDKVACHQQLSHAQLPVPFALSQVQSYEDLRHKMRESGLSRVFIKSRFGSGGSGVIALALGRNRVDARTTTVFQNKKLWDHLKVYSMNKEADIAVLINQLAPWSLHVERWIPKAQLQGQSVDLRVLVIAGEPTFFVLRKSKTPITNLHLLNERDDAALLQQCMSESAWEKLLETCRTVGKLFPKTYQLGIDIAVHSDFHHHSILELNAFGDFLKGITYQGLTPYQWQIKQVQNWLTCEH